MIVGVPFITLNDAFMIVDITFTTLNATFTSANGADQSRLGKLPRRTSYPRRPQQRALRPVHGHADRANVQPDHPLAGPAADPDRQAVQKGDDGVHAEAADDPEHDGQNRREMENAMHPNYRNLNLKNRLKISTAAAVAVCPLGGSKLW